MNIRTGGSFFADNSLNGLAYLALRVASPLRAKRWLSRIGCLYPTLSTPEDAQRMMKRLGNRGTCLSRSLAIRVRCPSSEVVIGVQSPHNRAAAAQSTRAVDAHAWVEVGGVAVNEGPDSGWVEIGRL